MTKSLAVILSAAKDDSHYLQMSGEEGENK